MHRCPMNATEETGLSRLTKTCNRPAPPSTVRAKDDRKDVCLSRLVTTVSGYRKWRRVGPFEASNYAGTWHSG